MQNKKKHILIMVILFILFSLISFIFYRWKFDDIANSPKQVFSSNIKNTIPTDIIDGEKLTQVLDFDGQPISSLSIKLATHNKVNSGSLNIKLIDDLNTVYYDKDIDISTIYDNQYYNFALDKIVPANSQKDNKYTLEITADYYTNEDKLSIYIGDTNNSNLSINNNVFAKKGIDILGFCGINFSLKIAYILISILFIAGLLLIYYLLFSKKLKIEKAFLVVMLISGIMYMSIFTPYSIPDEPSHVDTSYRYSNLMMFKPYSVDDGKMLIRSDDYKTLREDKLLTKISPYVYGYVNDNMFDFADSNELIKVDGHDVKAPFWMYLPQSLGMTIARLFSFGTIPMLYFGKLFNLLAFCLMTYFAMRRSPICKIGYAIIALFPITIHLTSSFSSDAVVLGVSFLFVSECLYLMKKSSYINKYDVIRMGIYSFLLAPCKSIAYLPICFLCFIIPKKLFENRKKQIIFYCTIIGSGIISVLLMSLPNFIALSNDVWVNKQYYSLGFILKNPMQFFHIVLNTLHSYLDFYIFGIVGKALGWFSINVHNVIVVAFILLFFASFIKDSDEELDISTPRKVWIAIICFGVFVAIHVGLFIGWTVEGSKTIEGVQGRYLLPIMLLCGIMLRNNFIIKRKQVNLSILFTAYILQSFTIMSIVANNF